MSSYTTHNFQAMDRPLSSAQMAELDQLSSRFSPSSRSFVLNYSYSDFRHDPEAILLKYFDLYVSESSWGTTQILFRFPDQAVDIQQLKPYGHEGKGWRDGVRVYQKEDYVILNISSVPDDGGIDHWLEEGEDALANACVRLRADILAGDLRALFVGYLGAALPENIMEEDPKDLPPLPLSLVPAKLDQANADLELLADVLQLDHDIISALVIYQASAPTAVNFKKLLKHLPAKRKDKYLWQLAKGKENLSHKLCRELTEIAQLPVPAKRSGTVDWSAIQAEINRLRYDAEQASAKAAATAELARLKQIADNEPGIRKEIEFNAESGRGKAYAKAVEGIRQLRDLAVHRDILADFEHWLADFRARHGRRPALMRRLVDALGE